MTESRDLEHLNPAPTSTGMTMYEQWTEDPVRKPYLVVAASTPFDMKLEPGDVIVQRRWAPAGAPKVYKEAQR